MQAVDFHAGFAREVGIHPAGQHRVHLDVVRGPRGRERFRELHDAALARAIGRRKSRAEDREHRTDVDDLAATGALQMRIRRATAEECAVEIGGDHLLPFVEFQRLNGLADVDAGVVDEDVDVAATGLRLLEEARHGVFVGHVGFDGQRLGA